MNNQEAIEVLRNEWMVTAGFGDRTGLQGALEMAIAALERQHSQCGERKCEALSWEWIEHQDEMECFECGSKWNYCDNDTERFNFCPNCGANCQPKGES